MFAIGNGLALHGGFLPYEGTFLVFSDYGRNAIRMAALMRLRHVFVFTHDSIGLGEDGPTHQAIEHASSLRLIPQLDVWRPCDTVETAVAWAQAIARGDGASALLLLPAERGVLAARRRRDRRHSPRRLRACGLRGHGQAGRHHRDRLRGAARAAGARNVSRPTASMRASCRCPAPACSIVRTLPIAHRCFPPGVPRVAVEAGVTDFWRKYVGAADDPRGAVVGIDRFGESAPAGALFKHFGFTAENVAAAVRSVDRFVTERRLPSRAGRRRGGHRAGAHRRVAAHLPRHDARRVSRRDEPVATARRSGSGSSLSGSPLRERVRRRRRATHRRLRGREPARSAEARLRRRAVGDLPRRRIASGRASAAGSLRPSRPRSASAARPGC